MENKCGSMQKVFRTLFRTPGPALRDPSSILDKNKEHLTEAKYTLIVE